MSQASLLDQIRDANRSFLSGEPEFLPPEGAAFVVLTCIDPRLTGFLEPALGLPRHRALIVRTAGNRFSDTGRDSIRSLVAGVYLKAGTELLVVGHTDCALARFSANVVIENFRSAGIPRSAFGEEDLRHWFGAFHDVRSNVLETVSALRKSGFFPPGFKIHGLVINVESGALEVVLDGNVATGELAAVSPPGAPPTPPIAAPREKEPRPEPDLAPELPPISQEQKIVRPVIIQSSTPPETPKVLGKQPTSMLDAAMILREFVMRERKAQRFQKTVAELNTLMRRERNPSVIMDRLGDLVSQYKAQYPQLPGALAIFKKSLDAKGPKSVNVSDWMRRILD